MQVIAALGFPEVLADVAREHEADNIDSESDGEGVRVFSCVCKIDPCPAIAGVCASGCDTMHGKNKKLCEVMMPSVP